MHKINTDNELLNLLKSGHKSALDEIYNRYYAILYSHAYSKLPDREEVRDIVQEVFVSLWNNREKIVITSSLSAYLYTSTRSRVLDIYRRQKVRNAYTQSLQAFIDSGENITEEKFREKELIRLVEKEVASLPAQMRRIFEMSRFKDMTHQQIADELQISPQTVRTQVKNALRVLRVKLGAHIFTIFF
ncbi:RNA polymerase sigma-70 factor [Pseudopedobacter beijingensis]|uniref:RNA polymerase sigma-70 factor n=1 Tax=Pseudopedobacter beijingensis TaxID=1207056 RepID=A0ABW4I9S2_9SPHI